MLCFHWNSWQALAPFCLQKASTQATQTSAAAEVFCIQQGNRVLHVQKMGDISWNANNLPVWFLLKMVQGGVFRSNGIFIEIQRLAFMFDFRLFSVPSVQRAFSSSSSFYLSFSSTAEYEENMLKLHLCLLAYTENTFRAPIPFFN